MPLSKDMRRQLDERVPFSQAVRLLVSERNGAVIKQSHTNPSKRAKAELAKLKRDFDDLTLTARRLDDEERHNDLFSFDRIIALLDAVLDVSENQFRTAAIGNKEQQIIKEFRAQWEKEAQTPFVNGKISQDRYDRKKKEYDASIALHLKPINEAFQRERIPDARRTELAAKIAGFCLDYCSAQHGLIEPDLPTVNLFDKSLQEAKILSGSIAGKVRRLHPSQK